jgi:hypothetical protein
MTSSGRTTGVDPQMIFEQISDLIRFAIPIADRLMVSGNLNGAVDEGTRMAIEALLGKVGATGAAGPQPSPQPASPERRGTTTVIPPSYSSVASGMMTGLHPATPFIEGGLRGAQMLSDFMKDYHDTVQRETTKRVEINARKDVRIAEIESVRTTMEMYLKLTFDERRGNFDRMFDALDEAQAKGDLQSMQLMLSGILDLAKSSPLKDLATFKQSLDNPDFVLEL